MDEKEKMALAMEFAEVTTRFKKTIREGPHSEDIKRNEFKLLMLIIDRVTPEVKGVKVSELSTVLDITPAAVTHIINALEKKEYLERLSDKSDRRIVLVRLTEAGINAIDDMKKQFFLGLKELIGFLGEKDSREFIRIIELVTKFHHQKMNNMDSRT